MKVLQQMTIVAIFGLSMGLAIAHASNSLEGGCQTTGKLGQSITNSLVSYKEHN